MEDAEDEALIDRVGAVAADDGTSGSARGLRQKGSCDPCPHRTACPAMCGESCANPASTWVELTGEGV